jgi:hypothetical protein
VAELLSLDVYRVMKIPKVIRHLIQLAIFCLLAIALLAVAPHVQKSWRIVLLIATVPVAFFGALIISFYVDKIDLWLRRKSRDPIWLMTHEGKQWLASEEGQKWQKERVT